MIVHGIICPGTAAWEHAHHLVHQAWASHTEQWFVKAFSREKLCFAGWRKILLHYCLGPKLVPTSLSSENAGLFIGMIKDYGNTYPVYWRECSKIGSIPCHISVFRQVASSSRMWQTRHRYVLDGLAEWKKILYCFLGYTSVVLPAEQRSRLPWKDKSLKRKKGYAYRIRESHSRMWILIRVSWQSDESTNHIGSQSPCFNESSIDRNDFSP
jgi:hypothetical protein